MDLCRAILHLHPTLDQLRDFTLRDDADGRGPYIERWDEAAAGGPAPSDADLAAAWEAIAPSAAWDGVRLERVTLLAEADLAINKAEDQGHNASALRAYRQALRDVTKGRDPLNPAWPAKPWA